MSIEAITDDLLSGYWNEDEQAAQLGKSKQTLRVWRAKGEGPPVTWVGRSPYYEKAASRAWLKTQHRRTGPKVASR
jgi:hypothetical protein